MSGDMFFQLGVGLREAINNVYSGSDVNSWTYDGRAFKNGNGSQPAYGATFAGGDIISVALDMDAGTLTFYKNGVSQGVAFSSGLAGKTVFPQFGCYQAGRSQSVNFGQRPFAYTAPSGYKALCTQNLPAPSIVKSNTAFDTLAYAGNDSQTISGLNFSPDLVWVKSRSNATYNHQVHDSVRGPTAGMLSTNLIATENSTYQFTSFNNNGFTTASGNVAGINNSGNTFVAWAWDAGTSTVTNTTGTITSQVRANPTAGISIVGYTGNSTNNATIGHGLTSIPNFIILKNRDQAYYWRIYHSYYYNGGSPTQGLLMGPADGTGNRSSYTHDAAGGINLVNSTRFGVTGTTYEGVNYTGNRYIAYCFSDISGYSSFGSYVGNGSTNGPFVYLGFKPAWIMVKVVYTATGNNNYWIYDAARNPSNLVTTRLSPNETAVESYGGSGFEFADFVSNGIKFRGDNWGWNQNGTSYIYAAFAENPFKYSLAR
jgi:hypothetical protein